MPEISRFLGIVIKMFYRDHAPPHFHAVYGEHAIVVYLESGVVEGEISVGLEEDWRLASERKPLKAIQPLE